jgi:hypothetical protein
MKSILLPIMVFNRSFKMTKQISYKDLLNLIDQEDILELGGCNRDRDRDRDREKDRDHDVSPMNFSIWTESDEMLL